MPWSEKKEHITQKKVTEKEIFGLSLSLISGQAKIT